MAASPAVSVFAQPFSLLLLLPAPPHPPFIHSLLQTQLLWGSFPVPPLVGSQHLLTWLLQSLSHSTIITQWLLIPSSPGDPREKGQRFLKLQPQWLAQCQHQHQGQLEENTRWKKTSNLVEHVSEWRSRWSYCVNKYLAAGKNKIGIKEPSFRHNMNSLERINPRDFSYPREDKLFIYQASWNLFWWPEVKLIFDIISFLRNNIFYQFER